MNNYKHIKITIGDEFYAEYKINHLSNNTLEYQDDTCTNKLCFTDDQIVFTRENDEFLLIMDNTKETAFYKLKELNYELDIKVNYFDKRIENNKIIISYQLETNDKEISLILEGDN